MVQSSERGGLVMVVSASDGHVLLVKKLGGLFSVIIGCLLTAVGVTFESNSTIVVGVLFLALGAVLLTLKIIRRNQRSPLG
jgi:hypothetical protein